MNATTNTDLRAASAGQTPRMHHRSQVACALMPAVAVVFNVAAMWPLMHFLPFLPPSMSAEQVANVYRTNGTGIILGGILLLVGQVLYFPFFSVTAVQMRRIEGKHMVWTYTMLTSAVLAFVPIMPAAIYFMVAAYRPERSAEAIQSLSDLGFVFLLIPAIPTTLQAFSIAFTILSDRRADPVFPRWLAYFCLWMGTGFLPATVICLFKAGPFAWNGAIAFWMVFTVFGSWIFVMVWALLRAIRHQAAEESLPPVAA
jgi:hypothetical protein